MTADRRLLDSRRRLFTTLLVAAIAAISLLLLTGSGPARSQAPEPDSSSPETWVDEDGDWLKGEELAAVLGAKHVKEMPDGCQGYVEMAESGEGVCLDHLRFPFVDFYLAARLLQGHDVTKEELATIAETSGNDTAYDKA